MRIHLLEGMLLRRGLQNISDELPSIPDRTCLPADWDGRSTFAGDVKVDQIAR